MQTSLAAVRHRVRILLQEGHLSTAVKVARAATPKFPELPATTALWLADVLCQSGREADALLTLEGASSRGCAWERGVIENDPYLASIRGPALKDVVLASEEILAREQRSATAVDPVVVRARGAPRGVLLCLHGRADQAKPGTVRSWRAAVASGFALVVPQSTRLTVWPDRLYGWTDLEQARREVGLACEIVLRPGSELSRLPLVIGGLSNGADIAIQIAMSGIPLKPRGFIAVAPAVRELNVGDLPARPGQLYGTLVIGVWDYRREVAVPLWDALTAAGVATEFVGVARQGHAMPQERVFGPRLKLALRETLNHFVQVQGGTE